jgi:hypothetical protein
MERTTHSNYGGTVSNPTLLLQQTADRLAIMEAKAAYCRYSDLLDLDGMLTVFTEDCEFRYGPGDEVIVGTKAIREWYKLEVERTVASLHAVSNFEISFVSPDKAQSRCALHSWKRFVDRPEDRHRYVHYIEEWVRTDAGWRQSKLEYQVIGETGTDTGRGLEHLRSSRATA